jgi:hypothetical protein
MAVKDAYDPDGPFFVHHGVGSERRCSAASCATGDSILAP